jgi:ubiquinone/menaquinone biosynthesis C-methylase UbiE
MSIYCPLCVTRLTDLHRSFSRAEAWVYDVALADGILAVVRPVLAETMETFSPKDRVLDVGCGGGQGALAIAQAQSDVQVVGIDLSLVGVRRAVRRAGNRHLINATFARASALRLPFRSRSFATSVSFFSIKHWPDAMAGVAELVRVTQPGGHLLVVEINAQATPDQWRRYVDLTRIPAVLRSAYVRVTHPTVVRHSLDQQALDAAFRSCAPIADLRVEAAPDLPYVVARARVAVP